MVKGFTTNALSGNFFENVNRLSVIVFVVLSLALIITSKVQPSIAKNIRDLVITSTLPFVKILAAPIEYTSNIIDNIDDLANIHIQNKVLKQENERLRKGYLKSLQIEVENIYLKKLLSFVSEKETYYISARIVGNISGAFLRSAVINVGRDNGVKLNQAVVNDKGLVGRIIEVGDKNSRVLLLTDINSQIPIITNNSRERGILVGNNTKDLTLKFLPEDSTVTVGEMIITSGDGDVFPDNQPIGEIYKIDKENVLVKPYVNWNRLEFVSVVDY